MHNHDPGKPPTYSDDSAATENPLVNEFDRLIASKAGRIAITENSTMPIEPTPAVNVKQAVTFFKVSDIEASLRFYVEGLGFVMTRQWAPEGRIRWCWLELGDVAVMLQEYWRDGHRAGMPEGPLARELLSASCAPRHWRSTET